MLSSIGKKAICNDCLSLKLDLFLGLDLNESNFFGF